MKVLVVFAGCILIGTGIWFVKEDEFVVRYTMHRLKHESRGGYILYYNERIVDLAPGAVSYLARIFRTDNLEPNCQYGVSLALMSADPQLARDLFLESLAGDGWQVRVSLLGLYQLKYLGAFEEAVPLKAHPDPLTRAALARYLSLFSTQASIAILQELAEDATSSVRSAACRSLELVGGQCLLN